MRDTDTIHSFTPPPLCKRMYRRSLIILFLLVISLFINSVSAHAYTATGVDGDSVTIGDSNTSNTDTSGNSIVVGPSVENTGESNVVIGSASESLGTDGDISTYPHTHIYGNYGVAIGSDRTHIVGNYATATGAGASVTADYGSAYGFNSSVTGLYGTAIGAYAVVSSPYSTVIGANSAVKENSSHSIVIGDNSSIVNATYSTAIGPSASIEGGGGCNVALGNVAKTYYSPHGYALGCCATLTNSAEAYALGHYSTITNSPGAYTFGVSATINNAANAYAIGYKASSTAANSIALGSNSVADTAYTISVGNTSGTNYRIVNMASGLSDKDAVNVAQLKAIGNAAAAALGGSSTYTFSSAGVSTLSPSFILEGVTYSNVQSALSSLEYSVRYDSPDKNTITLGGTTPVTVSNVADGTKAGDAVNFGQFSSLGNKVAEILGGDFSFENGSLTGALDIEINGNHYTSISDALSQMSEGWTFEAVNSDSSGTSGSAGGSEGGSAVTSEASQILPGDTLTVNAGSNIEITGSDKEYTISVSDNPKFEHIETGSIDVADGKVVADENGLTVAGADGSVKIDGDSITVADKIVVDKDGIDMGGTKLTGLGKGDVTEGSTDAVTGGQLWETNQTVDKIGSVLGGPENGYKTPTFDKITVGDMQISGAGIDTGGKDISTGGGNIDMGGGRITNLESGRIEEGSSDAVTGDQLWEAYRRMDGMGDDLYRRMDDLREDVNIVGAHAAALSGLHPIQYNPYEPTTLSAAIGTYRDEYAVAVGVFHYARDNVLFNLGASLTSDGDLMGRAGISFAVGKGGEKREAAGGSGIQQQLAEVRSENRELRAELDALKNQIALLYAR